MKPIYDRSGLVVGWLRDGDLYSPGGRHVGVLNQKNVYGHGGQHLGVFENGFFRDHREEP